MCYHKTNLVENGLVRWAFLHSRPDLVKVFCPSQLCVAVRIQQPKIAVKLAPVVSGELCANTVERDIQGSPVCLQKLKG